MKKNAMLKIAAILMVAVLLTTCAISSTFAKYVSSASDSETARVAKWGVDVKTTLDGLFVKTRTVGDKLVVSSSTKDNVVAPGMSGSVTTARQITGTPEVAIAVVTDAVVSLDGWGDHCPLVFTIKYGDENKADVVLTQTGNVDAFESAIQNAIHANAKEYAPNAPIDNTDISEISWTWAFEVTGSDEDKKTQNDIDSDLGDLAAKDKAPTVTIELTTSVTQIEK